MEDGTKTYGASAIKKKLGWIIKFQLLFNYDVRTNWIGSLLNCQLTDIIGSNLFWNGLRPILFVGAEQISFSNQKFRGLCSLPNILTFRNKAKAPNPSNHNSLLMCCSIIYAEAIQNNFSIRDYYLKLIFRCFKRVRQASSACRKL